MARTMKISEITESNDQYLSMWKVLAGDRKGADIGSSAGLSRCWADSTFPFWNALFLTEQISDPKQLLSRLQASCVYMRSKQQSGLVYVCEDFLSGAAREDLDKTVVSAGLEFALDIMGMVGDVLPFETITPHPSLQCRRVTDEDALMSYADINAEGYGFPLEAVRGGLEGSTFWKETAFSFIGYENGRAVSTAAAIVNDGQLYLALVATRPDAQRKGYGEATVRHALNAAYQATGLKRTSLHATDAGSPVYQRVGYHYATKFKTYKAAP
jgi:GNAT superfamily N-acetyltransferase